MSTYGERIDETTVRFERLLPGPIERVWEFLTDPARRARWLAGGRTERAVDGIIELEFNNASLSPLPDDPPPPRHADLPDIMRFSGKLTRFEPPTALAHTWEDKGDYSEVEYLLQEQDDKVLLIVTHTRLQPDIVLGVLGGWHTHLDILDDVLRDRTPQAFWKRHTALENEYQQRGIA